MAMGRFLDRSGSPLGIGGARRCRISLCLLALMPLSRLLVCRINNGYHVVRGQETARCGR